MQSTLTWHGHSNFQIITPSASILIDPWFDGNPTADVASSAMSKVDLVLVTHDHGDHTGQALEICRTTGAQLLAIVETAEAFKSKGLPKAQIVNGGINIGGTIDFKGIQITMVQSFHSSATGRPVGYIIRLEDGYTLYHSGDTGIFSTMELFGKLYHIDLAMLPIGGVYTMDPRTTAYACRLLRCTNVVPMHWGTFGILEQNTTRFASSLAEISPDTKLFTMRPGQTIPIGRSAPIGACNCD